MTDPCLIVVDIQNDFCEHGALAVPGANDDLVQRINRLMNDYDHVVLTQDWHAQNHSSFASQHEGRKPFDTIDMPYGEQTLWPDHCIKGSMGAQFHPLLEWNHPSVELIIRKGTNREIDSYSAFLENDHATPTGLHSYIAERGFTEIDICGLALDYCVGFTALDAVNVGAVRDVSILTAYTRAIDQNDSLLRMVRRLRNVEIILDACS